MCSKSSRLTMSPLAPFLERLPLPMVRRRKRRGRHARPSYLSHHRRAPPHIRPIAATCCRCCCWRSDEEANGARMTDTQVRDEAMTLFLAGHETTANALTWTWHLLAQHPDVERRLHEEIDAVLGDRMPARRRRRAACRTPEWCWPSRCAVIRRPGESGAGRIEDVEIGGYIDSCAGRSSSCRSTCCITTRGSSPSRSGSTRIAGGRNAHRRGPRFAYFPFGGGNRVCIGESFAWMEGILVLATLAREWRLERLDAGPVPMKALITLRPARSIRMRAHSRRLGARGSGLMAQGS